MIIFVKNTELPIIIATIAISNMKRNKKTRSAFKYTPLFCKYPTVFQTNPNFPRKKSKNKLRSNFGNVCVCVGGSLPEIHYSHKIYNLKTISVFALFQFCAVFYEMFTFI